jgi:hypothetical protein
MADCSYTYILLGCTQGVTKKRCRLHHKKSFSIFPSPAGMSLTKLSLGGNNLYLTSLFPPLESLVSDIPAGDGNIEKLFYGVSLPTNRALVIRVQMRGEGESCRVSANEYSCAHHVTWSPNKLWRSNSIFNLWLHRNCMYEKSCIALVSSI